MLHELVLATSLVVPSPTPVDVQLDLVYKTVNQVPLRLDLYTPESVGPFPVVLWIHGGGWQAGNKSLPMGKISGLLEAGIAVASINYRLTSQGALFGQQAVLFPAQLDDVQDAILFLRASAADFDLDPARVGAWGTSAGGHLAALAGVRGSASDPRGDTSLQAIGDGYGPTELFALDVDAAAVGCTAPVVHDDPGSPESKLVGFVGPDEGLGVLANMPQLPEYQLILDASPLLFVDAGDPPLLALHGQTDCTIALPQSQKLVQAYLALGLDGTLIEHPGGHSLPAEFVGEFWDFFIEHLDGVPAQREVLHVEEFSVPAMTLLDAPATPPDFDNETIIASSTPWGGCNLGVTNAALTHAVAFDPHPAVSTDGGSLWFHAGALSAGSRAYTRLATEVDASVDPELELLVTKANQPGGVRLRVLLRAADRWWRSEALASPEVANPTGMTSWSLELAELGWRVLSAADPAALDMDELDAGGEYGALGPAQDGAPDLSRVDGLGLELAAGNALAGMLAIERLELSRAVDADCNGVADSTQAVLGLAVEPCQVSLSAGSVQALTLDAGAQAAGQNYLLVGSMSGTQIGTPLGGGDVLPLNTPDAYFEHTLAWASCQTLTGSFGALDAAGHAAASFQVPAALASSSILVGLVAHHAFVVFDFGGVGGSLQFGFVSNAAGVRLDP